MNELPAISHEDLKKARDTVQAIRKLLAEWVQASTGTAAAYFPLEARERCMPILDGCLKGIAIAEEAAWTLHEGLRKVDQLDEICASVLPARPGQGAFLSKSSLSKPG